MSDIFKDIRRYIDYTYNDKIDGYLTTVKTFAQVTGLSKNIYLFGEIHDNSYSCDIRLKPEQQFSLIDILQNELYNKRGSDFMIDVFIEKHLYDNGPLSNSYMNKFKNNFMDCLTLTKKNCKNKNLRMHSVDTRKLNHPYIKKLRDLYWCIKYAINYIDDDDEYICLKEKINHFEKDDIKEIHNTIKAEKEISKIKDINIKKHLIELNSQYNDYFISIIDKLNECVDFINHINNNCNKTEYINELLTNSETKLKKWIKIVRFLYNLLMDQYLLSRLFKTFNDPKHKETENIIIYGGSNHIKFYISFLTQQLEMKLEKYITYPGNRCIDLNEIIPLFE